MKIPFLSKTDVGAERDGSPFSPGRSRLAQAAYVGVFVIALYCGGVAAGADFTVTYPGGSAYAINGTGNNPTLTLVRGELYTFFINNVPSNHPFLVASTAGAVTNNNIISGTISFRVPTNAANYAYRCSIHGFGGSIVTVPRPTLRIVKVEAGANLLLRSTGTTNWNLLPEYKTNVLGNAWVPLTVQTNRFANGTNETICGRPASSNIVVRIKAQRN